MKKLLVVAMIIWSHLTTAQNTDAKIFQDLRKMEIAQVTSEGD